MFGCFSFFGMCGRIVLVPVFFFWLGVGVDTKEAPSCVFCRRELLCCGYLLLVEVGEEEVCYGDADCWGDDYGCDEGEDVLCGVSLGHCFFSLFCLYL